MAETPQRTVVNFKESCVDPLAKLVLLEAMSFAVEKAESRLDSLGKIFPGLEAIGAPIIQDIKDIRFSVENLNVCSISEPASLGTGTPPAQPPPAAVIKTFPKREQELIRQMPESLQTALAQELARKPGESVKEPDFWVKGEGITATKKKKEKEPPPPEPEKKERTQPGSWGPLIFEDKALQYSSPGFFLAQLHGGDVEKIRGKGNYIKQLDADGFDVYIGDKLVPPDVKKEDLEKLKGVGMRIKARKGKTITTPSGGVAIPQPTSSYPKPWTQVLGGSGETLYFEDAKGHPIPEAVWRTLSGAELDKLAPNTRKGGESSPVVFPIPGLPVRGGKTVAPRGSE